uniref:Uncharacterized protein n=1 Tax=Capitella teleta TaxID=283909 RepID=X2A914_CAPTE
MTTLEIYASLLAGSWALLLADVVIICVFFDGFSDLFTNKASEALLVSPVPGTISVNDLSHWLLVYLFQLPWLIYAFVCLFRKYKGQAFCISAPVIPKRIFLLFSISSFLHYVWMICVDRQHFIPATVVMLVSSVLLFTCVAISLNALNVIGPDLLFDGYFRDIQMVRMFGQNLIGVFATWSNIVGLVELSIILHYNLGVPQPSATLIVQVVLLLEILVIFTVDVFLLQHHSRFFLALYLRTAVDTMYCIIRERDAYGEVTATRFTIFIVAFGMFTTKAAIIVRLYCKGGKSAVEPLTHHILERKDLNESMESFPISGATPSNTRSYQSFS